MSAVVLDQENPEGPTRFTAGPIWEQSFTPSYDNVTGIAVNLALIDGVTQIKIELLDGNCGSVVATGTTPVSALGWQQVDFGGQIPVVPEQEYWFRLTTGGGQFWGSENVYTRGTLWEFCGPFAGGNWDMSLRTYSNIEPLAVEPTTWGRLKLMH